LRSSATREREYRVNHPLQPIDWRLERADEHLATLNAERDAFFDQEDRRIVGEFERDTSEYVFRFSGEPPDPRIGLVVGEFAHNLRAALDNLVWQIVLLRGGTPSGKTQFPIYESWEGYQSSIWMLRGVSADDRALIEAVEPFKHGEHAPQSYLALLAWLNNVDKHRFVHAGCALPRPTPIQVSYGEEGPDAGLFPWNPFPVHDIRKILGVRYAPMITSDDRTELARVRIETSGPNPEMKMEGNPPVDISLSDPHEALLILDLQRAHGLVSDIVEAFRPRFNI